jgi:O-antigen ligase
MMQLVLAICFPVLGIKEVTTLFHSYAGDNATRMDTRVGAVGVFVHPGNLALFTTITSTFFLSCYLNNYKKKISLIILGVNVITLILTYSRTAYLVFLIDIALVYFILKNGKKTIFTISNVLKFIIPLVGALIYLVFFSPLSANFLESDTNEMFDARLIHWFMGFQTFISSPIIGVGINTHLEYMFFHFDLFKGAVIDDFFWENPIHNIHLIVLVETGLIGFVFWVLFIFGNISKSKEDIANKRNEILSATQIGLLAGISIYGITGWAPFSASILPFVLMISFFAIQFRKVTKK